MDLIKAISGPTNLAVSHMRYGGGYIALIGNSHESTYEMIDFVTDSGDNHEHLERFLQIVHDYPYAVGNTPMDAIKELEAKLKDMGNPTYENYYVAEGIFLTVMRKFSLEALHKAWFEISQEGYVIPEYIMKDLDIYGYFTAAKIAAELVPDDDGYVFVPITGITRRIADGTLCVEIGNKTFEYDEKTITRLDSTNICVELGHPYSEIDQRYDHSRWTEISLNRAVGVIKEIMLTETGLAIKTKALEVSSSKGLLNKGQLDLVNGHFALRGLVDPSGNLNIITFDYCPNHIGHALMVLS